MGLVDGKEYHGEDARVVIDGRDIHVLDYTANTFLSFVRDASNEHGPWSGVASVEGKGPVPVELSLTKGLAQYQIKFTSLSDYYCELHHAAL